MNMKQYGLVVVDPNINKDPNKLKCCITTTIDTIAEAILKDVSISDFDNAGELEVLVSLKFVGMGHSYLCETAWRKRI